MTFDWYSIEKLFAMSNKTEREKEIIKGRLMAIDKDYNEFSLTEFREIQSDLYANQLDPIICAMNYNQMDIVRHLRKLA